MGVGQTEQTEKVCRPDQSDKNMVIWQTEQTKTWVFTRPSRPKYGSKPGRTDQKIGIIQTEQTELRVSARPTTPKYGY